MKDTIVFVTEVPMLAPITIGIALRTVITLEQEEEDFKFKINIEFCSLNISSKLTIRGHHCNNDRCTS